MSHFTVLVISNDVEAALQPFHEYECTGTNDQYVQDVDKTAEVQERINEGETLNDALEYFGLGSGIVAAESEVQKLGDDAPHKWGYAIVADGKLIKAVDRTNPNCKWDWYQIGGRWGGKLILKSGATADSAMAGEVDWNAMIAKYSAEATAEHQKITSALAGRSITPWSAIYAKVGGDFTADQARDEYHGQPVKKELEERGVLDRWNGGEQLERVLAQPDREAYAKQQGETNATTWAMLRNGEWIERGRMGWFGMSDATDDSTAAYVANFWETVRALPADMLVSVVDCHI